jgi:RNA-directed DNA polymerase
MISPSPSLNKPLRLQKLSDLQTRQDLALALGVTEKGLCYTLYRIKPEVRYTAFEIAKKSGGVRQILAPIPRLKNLQKRLKKLLEREYEPRVSVHGFTQNRSIRTNAYTHQKKRYVFNIDLENFFPTITFPRVRGMLLKSPYNCTPAVATVIAQLCCHESKLPQGAPTSPIISNMICSKLDGQLARLAKKHDWTYSRYVDDITLTTNRRERSGDIAVKVEGIWNSGHRLEKIIVENGFLINVKKVRMQHTTDRQEVTGIVTNKKLNVRRSYIRSLRAILHNWKETDIKNASNKFFEKFPNKAPINKNLEEQFKRIIKGRIEYVGYIRGEKDDDAVYLKLLRDISELAPDLLTSQQISKIKFYFEFVDFILERLFVVEVYGDGTAFNQGTGFFLDGYGFVTCAHVLDVGSENINEIVINTRDMTKNIDAKIKVISHELDLAILDVNIPDAYEFEVGVDDEISLRTTTEVTIAGFPNHSSQNRGHLYTAKIRSYVKHFENPYFVIDIPIYFGQSGGPVFDKELKVVGIVARGKENENPGSDGGLKDFNAFIPVSQLRQLRAILS